MSTTSSSGLGGPARVDGPPGPARRSPVLRWLRRLPRQVFVLVVVAVIAALVLATLVVNPGHRIGPVDPARPPVGGPVLPATRL